MTTENSRVVEQRRRLAALVPPLRVNLVRFFAPNSNLSKELVPSPTTRRRCSRISLATEDEKTHARTRRWPTAPFVRRRPRHSYAAAISAKYGPKADHTAIAEALK